MIIAGISGSLRAASTNTYLLKNLSRVGHNLDVNIITLNDIPLFSTDITTSPESVKNLEQAINIADAVVIATPEYNYSITGALKNALDWISAMRPNPLTHKAISIMGVSVGNLGTVRAQMHLRDILFFMDAKVVNKPEVLVANSSEKFDAKGNLTDQTTLDFVQENLQALEKLVKA